MNNENHHINSDHAIEDFEADRFGLVEIAKHLAASVTASANKDGLIIGIEGKWGSGKSSLINLMCRTVEDDKNTKVSTIPIAPWLIGDKTTYVPNLLSALTSKIEEVGSDEDSGFSKEKVKETVNALRDFSASTLDTLAHILEFAEIAEPRFKEIKEYFRWGGEKVRSVKKHKSLSEQKQLIIDLLAAQEHRFIVVLDDLDRLEPIEAVEVLRMVKSVADFPNVIYLLCYDKEVLANAVEVGLNLANGEKYLQKFIQVSFKVPRPDSYDLRNWVFDETSKIWVDEDTEKQSQVQELRRIIYTYGTMETPREAQSIINSIKFYYPPVAGRVYFPDLVWLHIAKILQPDLFYWCEAYLTTWMAIYDSEIDRSSYHELELQAESIGCLQLPLWGDSLHEFLPGFQRKHSSNGRHFQVFVEHGMEAEKFKSTKRLGDPDCSRYYFAFTKSKWAMDESYFSEILNYATTGISAVRSILLELSSQPRQNSGSWLEYYFDKFSNIDFDNIPIEQQSNLALAIANSIDEAIRSGVNKETFGRTLLYDQASQLVWRLLNNIKGQDESIFHKTFSGIINEAHSIVWLLDNFIFEELMRHGIIASATHANEKQNISFEEAERARSVITSRLITDVDRTRLSAAPKLASPLFRWANFNDDEYNEPSEWFDEYANTDEGFVNILEKMRGWQNSSQTGVSHPLNKRDVAPFTDWELCLKRLQSIAIGKDIDEEMKAKAIDILENINEGK